MLLTAVAFVCCRKYWKKYWKEDSSSSSSNRHHRQPSQSALYDITSDTSIHDHLWRLACSTSTTPLVPSSGVFATNCTFNTQLVNDPTTLANHLLSSNGSGSESSSSHQGSSSTTSSYLQRYHRLSSYNPTAALATLLSQLPSLTGGSHPVVSTYPPPPPYQSPRTSLRDVEAIVADRVESPESPLTEETNTDKVD